MLPFSRNEFVSVAKPPTEWEKLWEQYINSYENWKQLFGSVQKASTDMHQRFNDVMGAAEKKSSSDTMKQFGENWQKAMNQAGIDAFKTFGESGKRP